MPALLTRELFLASMRPGAQVYWPGCAGHSTLFESWLQSAPERAAEVHFCGVWIPGVNRFDPTALHPAARASSFFLTPELRASWQRGALDLLPLHYSQAVHWLAAPGRFDVLLLQVAPPDDAGQCSLSVAADFAPTVLAAHARAGPSGAVVLAHVNPLLPRTHGPAVPVSCISAWVDQATPVLGLVDAPVDSSLAAVAQQVAALVHDGDTLQLGLGRLQAAVLAALASHQNLRVHSGMVSDGLLGLIEHGALAARSLHRPPVCTGVALGSAALYAALTDPALARFAPVSQTHAQATLAAVPRLVTVNSALQIDLFGQVHVDSLAGQSFSGVGGLVDFARGARASPGGRAIVAATARAGRAQQARIVPRLGPGAVGLGRADVDTVVTEYGAAALRQLGVDARAQALIGIAAPEHRAGLAQAWHTLRRSL
jgi:acyl-CoA hydrolase